jgi:hypothetical protein
MTACSVFQDCPTCIHDDKVCEELRTVLDNGETGESAPVLTSSQDRVFMRNDLAIQFPFEIQLSASVLTSSQRQGFHVE